ncbi:YoaK family protein [Sphingopyxis sp. R3-92]|uniref:YoaK family protein n=1 Tax=Sphingopyxis sp. R3-92 TaxID=3158553 RepID=UPI003EE7D005
MIRYDSSFQRLAFCLAALAGFVDAIGFLGSGGLFVSFMSGNSTRMAIGITEAKTLALAAGALIGLFVAGVFVNIIMAAKITIAHRKVVAVSGVAALLLGAACCKWTDSDVSATGLLCVAMGASNTIFRRDGDVTIGVTYMTGTLVKLGHRLADAALGGSRTAWIPYLLLWLALVSGGILGAASYSWSRDASLGFAAGFALLLIPVTQRVTAPYKS